MKRLIFTAFLFVAILLLGCCKSDFASEPETAGTGKGNNKIELSGAETGLFDATPGYLNTGKAVAISLTVKSGSADLDLLLSSSEVSTGSYPVPDTYNATFSDESKNIVYHFYTGRVEINEITNEKIAGTFRGKAFGTDLNTFVTDSTNVLILTAEFSL